MLIGRISQQDVHSIGWINTTELKLVLLWWLFLWLLLLWKPQAVNRKVEKLMEKDNKKIRDVAKKKRNEAVRVIRIILARHCVVLFP